MKQASLIGVISDTHGLLRHAVLDILQGCDLILHAGDVGRPEVLEMLRRLAPVVAVRGNVDKGPWAMALAPWEVVELGSAAVYVIHQINDLDIDAAAAGFSAVIYGHSHRPVIEWRHNVLMLNPGSAGPRRFSLPVSLALLEVREGRLEPRLIELDPAAD